MVGPASLKSRERGRLLHGTRAPAVPHRSDRRDRPAGSEPRRGRQRAQPPPRRGRSARWTARPARTPRLLDASMDRARTITLVMAHNAAFRGFYLAARQPRVEAAPRLHLRRRRERRPRLPGKPVPHPDRRAVLHRPQRLGERPGRARRAGPRLRPLARRGEQPVLRPHLRAAARPGLPVTALRVARHARLGRSATPRRSRWARSAARWRSSTTSCPSRASARQLRADDGVNGLHVVDARTGAVVIDSSRPQKVGAPLGVPGDRRFAALARAPEREGRDRRSTGTWRPTGI